MVLCLIPLLQHHCVWVVAVQGLPGDEHIEYGLSQVGEIPLIQDHYHVLHVELHKVDLEVGTT